MKHKINITKIYRQIKEALKHEVDGVEWTDTKYSHQN